MSAPLNMESIWRVHFHDRTVKIVWSRPSLPFIVVEMEMKISHIFLHQPSKRKTFVVMPTRPQVLFVRNYCTIVGTYADIFVK